MPRIFAAAGALGATLAAVLLFAVGANAATTGPSQGGGTGGVHVNNPHPHAGSTIVVMGEGCTAGAKVTVFFDSSPVATGSVNPAGKYRIPVKIPPGTASGHHQISVQVAGGSCPGSAVLGIEVVASGTSSSSDLAGTGVAVVGIGALGVVLLVGGGLMLLAGRRRNGTHV
ncbi:MAG TPA: hypothetical protein VGH43_08075 [Jatrophihabitans sp.]|jgi:hypothetical protein